MDRTRKGVVGIERGEHCRIQGLGRARRIWGVLFPSVLSPSTTICLRLSPPLLGAQWTPKGLEKTDKGYPTRSLVEMSLRKGEDSSCRCCKDQE